MFRILLIEDNPGDAGLIAEMLSESADTFTLTHVWSLAEAIRALQRDTFDLILTDLGLPDADRDDVVAVLRTHAHDLPVVVLTGFADDATAGASLAAGAQDYLVKGRFDTPVLEHVLRHSVERNRLVVVRARLAQSAELGRETAEAAVRASDERFAAFMAAFPVLASIKDASGRYVWVNERWASEFGLEVSGWLGQTNADLLPHDMESGVTDDDLAVLRDGKTISTQYESTRDGGAPRTHWEAVKFRFAGVDGQPLIGSIGIDITERRLAEEELARHADAAERAQALESLGLLAGGVAHDFNNLIGVVLNYVTLLERQVADDAARADLGEIRIAAKKGANLARQLLTFARRDVADPQPLDVSDLVRGVASMLERTLGDDIELRLIQPPRPVIARVDRHQLEQVVLNLVINARDAIPARGTVTIHTRAAPDAAVAKPYVEIRVVDTGSGMPPDVVARAFEPFFTTKPRGQGTGLGLSMVHGMVLQNGGEVTIESTVGVGTAITVRLPMAAALPIADTSAPDETAQGSERVLLVEDEAALRAATARLLRDSGYQVTTAGDGVEGIGVFEKQPGGFDLVVTDVSMPRMRGDEMARLIVAQQADMPIVFLTGFLPDAVDLPGPVLAKPVVHDDLLRTMRSVLTAARNAAGDDS